MLKKYYVKFLNFLGRVPFREYFCTVAMINILALSLSVILFCLHQCYVYFFLGSDDIPSVLVFFLLASVAVVIVSYICSKEFEKEFLVALFFASFLLFYIFSSNIAITLSMLMLLGTMCLIMGILYFFVYTLLLAILIILIIIYLL